MQVGAGCAVNRRNGWGIQRRVAGLHVGRAIGPIAPVEDILLYARQFVRGAPGEGRVVAGILPAVVLDTFAARAAKHDHRRRRAAQIDGESIIGRVTRQVGVGGVGVARQVLAGHGKDVLPLGYLHRKVKGDGISGPPIGGAFPLRGPVIHRNIVAGHPPTLWIVAGGIPAEPRAAVAGERTLPSIGLHVGCQPGRHRVDPQEPDAIDADAVVAPVGVAIADRVDAQVGDGALPLGVAAHIDEYVVPCSIVDHREIDRLGFVKARASRRGKVDRAGGVGGVAEDADLNRVVLARRDFKDRAEQVGIYGGVKAPGIPVQF